MEVWMNSEVTIGKYVFQHINEASIDTSWKTLSDIASLKVPNLKGVLNKSIKVGDPVEIKLGYSGELITEFVGYVASINPTAPFEIKCEDEMWNLKQQFVDVSWKSIKLKEVLSYLVPDAIISAPEITLAPFRLSRITKAAALEKIKQEYGLTIYFRGKSLYAGIPYATEPEAGKVIYHFQKNTPVPEGLIYKSKDDVKIKLIAISFLPNNSKFQIELGDADGEIHTMHFYNLTEAELKQQANDKLSKMKYDGYRGGFASFGKPLSKHSMVAKLIDDKYPERSGSFFIDSINISYSNSGFRRNIKLGKSA